MRKLENSELDRKSIEDFKKSEKTPLILVLDDIRSLHNIGSVFRTADDFLIEKIYLCGITAIPPNKEIHKTALGATETVAWEHAENVLDVITKLKSEKIHVETFKGGFLVEPWEVLKKDQSPYRVFTAYWNAFLKLNLKLNCFNGLLLSFFSGFLSSLLIYHSYFTCVKFVILASPHNSSRL